MVDGTVVATPAGAPPPSKSGMSTGDKIRFVLRGIGQTLITLGLVVLLFVVYEVWITNIFAAREQAAVTHKLKNEWATGKDPLLALPGENTPTIPVGTGIGVLYIPRLGRDYHFTIVQGSEVPDDSQLEKGPAHYAKTQLPGQAGNFAVAGHRVGKGEPFLNLDKLKAGDAVIVETKRYWYVYRVLGTPAGSSPQANPPSAVQNVPTKQGSFNVPGREIVDPSDGAVLFPVPNQSGVLVGDAKVALMTMTTCHPKFTASHRMILHAELDPSLTVDLGVKNENFDMPQSIQALYGEVKA